MIALLGRMKPLCYVLAWLICAELVPAALFAADDQLAVRNVHYEVTGELVRIYYDLVGTLDKVHRVGVFLRRESDSTFVYRPVYLTGDVGSIVFPGEKRRITWDFLKDFPEGVKGDDYYFTVEAEMVYLIRRSGQWPRFQTEIHFHPSEEHHRKVAKRLLKRVRVVP